MALASDYLKEKRKETVLEKYGVDNVGKYEVIKEKRKETCLKKYGVEYTTQLQSTIDKIHESKTKHKTHTCSKEEDKVYELLKTMYNDIRRQYKSEDYPFACDFILQITIYILNVIFIGHMVNIVLIRIILTILRN